MNSYFKRECKSVLVIVCYHYNFIKNLDSRFLAKHNDHVTNRTIFNKKIVVIAQARTIIKINVQIFYDEKNI